ncbi:MAG: heavy-metal-associated domain-containing protein [Coriobacteriia bacterium]|nr:heavy-metal-associated domain-containing protein [Coriobacteriia bacterium]
MASKTVTLSTSGMHCGSCSMLIDMTLADVPGVESSKTDHVDGTTLVSYDDDRVTIDEIIAAIRVVGYEAAQL